MANSTRIKAQDAEEVLICGENQFIQAQIGTQERFSPIILFAICA